MPNKMGLNQNLHKPMVFQKLLKNAFYLAFLTNNILLKKKNYNPATAPGLIKNESMFSYPKKPAGNLGTLTSVAGSLNAGAASEATSATTRTLVGNKNLLQGGPVGVMKGVIIHINGLIFWIFGYIFDDYTPLDCPRKLMFGKASLFLLRCHLHLRTVSFREGIGNEPS